MFEDVSVVLPSERQVRATIQYDTGSDSTYIRPWEINKHFSTKTMLPSRQIVMADGSSMNLTNPNLLSVPVLSAEGKVHVIEAVELPGFDRTPLKIQNPPPSEAALFQRQGQKKYSRPDILLGTSAAAFFPKLIKRCSEGGNNYKLC